MAQKHATSLDSVQREVVRLTRVLDRGIEAKDLAERFLDREKSVRTELDQVTRNLLRANEDLSQTKYLVQNKHDMTEKCKRQVKLLQHKCSEFESLKTRVVELEKSVMQVILLRHSVDWL